MNQDPLTQEQIRNFVLPAHGNLQVVKQMLAEEPRLLNKKYEEFDETALEAASHVGNRPITEFLLAQGAPMNIYTAAMLGQKETVAAYLEKTPELINGRGVHGISLLFHAALSGSVELAEMLVALGNTQSPDQPLLAAASQSHIEMSRWLLARGADKTATNMRGQTPLDIARQLENEALINLFL